MKTFQKIIPVFLVIALAAGGGYYWWMQQQNQLPDNIAVSNGRIEAEEIYVATKYGGRVQDVLVDEGDMVEEGQVLALMDKAELEATLSKAKAEVVRAENAVSEAQALISQRKSELKLAEQELSRSSYLVEKGHASKEILDQRQAARDTAIAALEAANANLISSEKAVEATIAEVRRIQTIIDDSVIKSRRRGRIQYRLAEPGEVLSSGGRVVTLLDLSNVHMSIFLPTSEVGRIFEGAEARIILDAAPQLVIPAKVSFVSGEAQFTPKEVETRTERDKLMFRVKVKIDPDLLLAHIEKVKTGLPGEAYVMLGSNGSWPDSLAVNLPPETVK